MKMFSKKETEKRLPEIVLKRIPIANLRFAPYQRELKMAKVRKIANNFIPDVVGIALVSFRDGEFWCLDAQHRVKAMEMLGYKEIWCQVITGLSYKEECERFNLLNTGRTQLTSNQVFHCKVEGGDKNALALVDMFLKYRFDYNKSNGVKSQNVIGAVSKFEKMQKKYSMEMVERVLRTLRNTWYGDADSLSSAIITGLSTFYAENQEVDDMILIKSLEQITPNALITQATAYVKLNMLRPGRSDSACYHIAKIIGQLYEEELNKPTRGKRARGAN